MAKVKLLSGENEDDTVPVGCVISVSVIVVIVEPEVTVTVVADS